MNVQTWLEHKVQTLYEITRAINARLNQQKALSVLLERVVTDLGYRAATLRLHCPAPPVMVSPAGLPRR